MRNYVIINGENSLDIQGLAINTLPPITKPMIRTRTEEIDGRDGDIITELGYGAYDKQMEIGLWGTYDIDSIIKYFTGEGTIVFSTEPDKYYYFKILNQIDYEKLLKFKKATVTFHCQPFKYPIEEEPEEAEMVTLTGTGESITLEDTQVGKMKVDLKGNTQQGLPSGYQAVEYIESSGTQYIDTGYVYNADDVIDIEFMPLNATGDLALFGAYQSSTQICELGYYNGKLRGNINEQNSITYSTDTKYKVQLNNGVWHYNGNAFGNTYNTTMTINCYLFTRNYNNAPSKSSSNKVYSLKMTRNNVVIKYFIPCYRTSDSVIGLYDLVEGKFYTNAGTGTFAKGNDITLPTPDTPIDIQVVSGDNTIKVEGKNLLDLDRTLGQPSNTAFDNTTYRTYNYETYIKGLTANNYYANNNVSCSLTNNSFVITNTNGGYGVGIPILLEAGENYTLSAEITGTINAGLLRVAYYTESGEYINNKGSSVSNKYVSFTVPNNAPVCVLLLVPEARVETTYTNIQLEKGSTATPYQPYQSTTYPISLGNIELCKIGTYQDSIVKDNGKWYLNKQIGKKIVLESEILAQTNSYTNVRYFKFNKETNDIDYNKYNETSLFYSHAKLYNSYDYDTASAIGKILPTPEATRYWVGFSKSSTLSEAKEKLTNSILYYPLKTPTYEEITDTTLLGQLNNLYNANSYEGTTNVSQVNDDMPFILDVSLTFLKPIEVNNIGNIYAKPILTIEGSGNIGVILNDIQILQIDLGEGGKITIDVPNLEAYNPDNNLLMNRLVTGDYMKLLINEGDNEISFDGDVSGATLTNYTRWI